MQYFQSSQLQLLSLLTQKFQIFIESSPPPSMAGTLFVFIFYFENSVSLQSWIKENFISVFLFIFSSAISVIVSSLPCVVPSSSGLTSLLSWLTSWSFVSFQHPLLAYSSMILWVPNLETSPREFRNKSETLRSSERRHNLE